MGSGDTLTLPVIKDASSKGLKTIAAEVANFEDIVYAEGGGTILHPSMVALGTFSIHNLGMYGVKSAAPIVLPPQGNFLLIYICNFHVLSDLLLIYICKLEPSLCIGNWSYSRYRRPKSQC